MINIKSLEKKIKYKFNNKKILIISLTHRSYNNNHNERLEFLGDSILNFIITKKIYKNFSNIKEGVMTRIRSRLVNKKNLFKIANKINLNKYILLGNGEIKNKKIYNKKSILANTIEAIIGAIYIDSKNINKTEKIIKLLFFKNNIFNIKKYNYKDYKTILQEYLQKLKLPLPKYFLGKKQGKDHDQIFTIYCKIKNSNKITKGKGKNKKNAEQIAAKKALINLGLILKKCAKNV